MKKRILVVDDDLQVRESLGKLLRAEGYDVVPAADRQAAIREFYTGQVDLMLLDLVLPDGSGWDVFGTLSSDNPFLPIIIITGKENQRDLARLAGVGAVMEKPLNVYVLLKTIVELMSEDSETRLRRLAGFRNDTRLYKPNTVAVGKWGPGSR